MEALGPSPRLEAVSGSSEFYVLCGNRHNNPLPNHGMDRLLQNKVDGDEHGVGHRHGRPVLSAFRCDALVLSRKIRTPYSAGHLGALHQHGLQRLVPFARLAVIPLPGTLLVARTDPSPGAQMYHGGEPAHIYACLRQNDLRAAPGQVADTVFAQQHFLPCIQRPNNPVG